MEFVSSLIWSFYDFFLLEIVEGNGICVINFEVTINEQTQAVRSTNYKMIQNSLGKTLQEYIAKILWFNVLFYLLTKMSYDVECRNWSYATTTQNKTKQKSPKTVNKPSGQEEAKKDSPRCFIKTWPNQYLNFRSRSVKKQISVLSDPICDTLLQHPWETNSAPSSIT